MKKGPKGRFWVIEPTVGRTDFWSGLCSANGVPFPVIEYHATLDRAYPAAKQIKGPIWINGERQPTAMFWLALHHPRYLLHGIKGVYFKLTDPVPFIRATWHTIRGIPKRLFNKVAKLLNTA